MMFFFSKLKITNNFVIILRNHHSRSSVQDFIIIWDMVEKGRVFDFNSKRQGTDEEKVKKVAKKQQKLKENIQMMATTPEKVSKTSAKDKTTMVGPRYMCRQKERKEID